ncbi:hypothetical protein DFH28DRAFT_1096186 [Melampsora americana]|nr:hypothetical protein DFH28DRAFT_1096186 [Melampsora americana]
MMIFNRSLVDANAAIPSHLHPVALRSTTHASNPQTAADGISGLPIDHSIYPLLSTLDSSAPHANSIKLLTCSDYAHLYHAYLRSTAHVDESIVFPYLHCPDRPGTSQSTYFSQAHHHHPHSVGPTRRPPSYRGLTVITADSVAETRTTTARHRTRSLGSTSTVSASSLSSSAPLSSTSSPATSVEGPEPRASLLVSALTPDEILERSARTGELIPRFIRRPMPSSSVNLRLFGHQAGQYATISDIVIYSESGVNERVKELAKLIIEAQLDFRKSLPESDRKDELPKYHVFLINERFEGFEKEFSELVAVDGWGFRRSKIDFFERERLEMESLTCASLIEENLWLGNTADAMRDEEELCPPRFSIMIEAHDSARILTSSELESLFPTSLSSSPSTVSSPVITRPPLHLEVPSTASASGSMPMEQLVRSLQEFCGWVARVTGDGHQVLVHCHDGYTETSLFGLAYTIYRQRIPLSDAYLHLQLHANRSFFLYPSDLTVLRYFERRCSSSDPSMNPIPRGARWLEDGFEGHFPSRILPFLYLGNLSHANNPSMLRALGITAVVSMGESARSSLVERGLEVLDVKSVADDGLDKISAHLPSAMEFIERIRRSGGKVLVHCRVGVSRSATVVIGYVMIHCDIDLASAYLLVRSRRLNILIQPNLVFMWALRRWESRLNYFEVSESIEEIMKGNSMGCDCGVCFDSDQDEKMKKMKRRVGSAAWTWSSLSLEISLLNQRYLC